MDDFVEVSTGYFIEKKQYDGLVHLGIKKENMESFMKTRISHLNKLPSQRGKPLRNQKRQGGF